MRIEQNLQTFDGAGLTTSAGEAGFFVKALQQHPFGGFLSNPGDNAPGIAVIMVSGFDGVICSFKI